MQISKYMSMAMLVLLFTSINAVASTPANSDNTTVAVAGIEYSLNKADVNIGAGLWDDKAKDWTLAYNEDYKKYLGWLYVYNDILTEAPSIMSWADSLKNKYRYCVVLGMGGSSLSVEAMRRLFNKKKGYPELIVLDTSNPDTFFNVQKNIDLSKTLFILSSKSGTTAETLYGYRFFFDKLKEVTEAPASHFIAITDEGSFLDKEGKEKQFLRVFLNRKDIGGRFSALSYFGMIPAAIAGYDIRQILASAKEYSDYLKTNPYLPLALADLISPSSGKYKRLFLNLDDNLSGFGLWIEQLTSESLGKDGKGVLPIIINKRNAAPLNGEDVLISIGRKASAKYYGGTGCSLSLNKETDIGKQFLLWEFVAAYAGADMGVNPFDQPDVELAKKLTNKMIKENEETLIAGFKVSEAIKVEYGSSPDVSSIVEKEGKKAAYITLLIYADLNKQAAKAVKKFAAKVQAKTNTPVVITSGPRYLHSLGQLHKGGTNNGLFIIVSDIKRDIVLSDGNSMKKLILAQAYGDFLALDERGRRVIKVNLDGTISIDKYFNSLTKKFK